MTCLQAVEQWLITQGTNIPYTRPPILGTILSQLNPNLTLAPLSVLINGTGLLESLSIPGG
jgi:hypothetical protein